MNVSQSTIKAFVVLPAGCGAVLAFGLMAGVVNAAPVPTAVSTPVGAAVQSVGGVVTAAGQGHAGIAPTVYSAAPAVEPFADGVTNALGQVGAGTRLTGQNIQSGGLAVNPIAGARTGLQTVRNGTLVQARVGSLAVGQGAPSTIVGVGALTTAPPQGTLATAGVANANALLNANVAPQ